MKAEPMNILYQWPDRASSQMVRFVYGLEIQTIMLQLYLINGKTDHVLKWCIYLPVVFQRVYFPVE